MSQAITVENPLKITLAFAERCKKQRWGMNDVDLLVYYLNHYYQDWAEARAIQNNESRPGPLDPEFERRWLQDFFNTLAVEGLVYSPEILERTLKDLMED